MLTIAGGIILAIIFLRLLPFILAITMIVVAAGIIIALVSSIVGSAEIALVICFVGWIIYCYWQGWQEYKRTHGSPFN